MLFSSLWVCVHVLPHSLAYVPFSLSFSSLRSPHVLSLAMHEVFHPASFISISISISELAFPLPQSLYIVTNILRVIREPDLVPLPMNLVVKVFTLINWIRYLANTSSTAVQVSQVSEPALEQALSFFENNHTLAMRCKSLSSHCIYAFIYFTIVNVILLIDDTRLFPSIPCVYNRGLRPGSKNKWRQFCPDLHGKRCQLIGLLQEIIESLLVKNFWVVLDFFIFLRENSLK